MIERARQIIRQAVAEHDPVTIFALFSGGHDSLTSTHVSMGIAETVVHINTGIGVEQTRVFVRETCKRQEWYLRELHPPAKTYRDMVLANGFPGPGGHLYPYVWLKERGIIYMSPYLIDSMPNIILASRKGLMYIKHMETKTMTQQYTPKPIIMWKLSRKDATRISCHCGRPARFGSTADGGAPYNYDCSKHVPVGVPIEMCFTKEELVAAVISRNSLNEARM